MSVQTSHEPEIPSYAMVMNSFIASLHAVLGTFNGLVKFVGKSMTLWEEEEVTDVRYRGLVYSKGFSRSCHIWCVCVVEENCIFQEGTNFIPRERPMYLMQQYLFPTSARRLVSGASLGPYRQLSPHARTSIENKVTSH